MGRASNEQSQQRAANAKFKRVSREVVRRYFKVLRLIQAVEHSLHAGAGEGEGLKSRKGTESNGMGKGFMLRRKKEDQRLRRSPINRT